MDWSTFISELFTIVLIPLLGILVKYFINFVQIKSEEIKANNKNVEYNKYIDMLENTITTAVVATNQTYVDSLKAQGKFDQEAQVEALNKSYSAVMSILTEDAQKYLNEIIGDLRLYIMNSIEERVHDNKIQNG